MPQELSTLEEFDILSELQFPEYIFSIDSIEEQLAFSTYISSLSGRRILIVHDGILNYPFVVAGLTETHIEIILKEGSANMKKTLMNNILNIEFQEEISRFITELDRHNKTTENFTRFKNILQYVKDNKIII